MDAYLRSVRSTLGAGGLEGFSIHIVLGGPEADVNTVASTLSLALHLSQKDVGGGVCVPVLAINGCGAVLPRETARYLQSLKVRETSLMWREEVDVMKFHHTGNLSLTLLTDDALDSSEYEMLASSITRVVHHHGQRDADQEDASSTAMAVAREILQEAAEHVRGVLGEVLGEALRLQKESLWIQHGRRSAQLEELVDSLEKWCAVTAAQHPDDAKLQDKDIDQLSLVLKEFTDGEMNLAITAVTMVTKDWYAYLPELKSVCHHHNYDCLVVVNETVDPPHHQVAVYSDHTDILNQICCELEESPCWSHSNVLEASECFQGSLQIYHVPVDTFSSPSMAAGLEEGLRSLLKAFMERRGSVLACHPTSRNSSTEGVAGSVEFSQGSSGINDMYGSDAERTCADEVSMAGEMADGEGESGGAGIGGGIGELVSPDSGMATIRSSRSSKESSVFLSDDSPIGEMVAGVAAGAGGLFLRNPSPLGFSSLSTPIPPERRKQRHSRNRSDNLDLFSFDPLHSGNPPMPAEGLLEHSEDSSRAESSSLSEFEELSLVDFSAPVPPTVNSLVGSCPPHHCGVSFFQQDRTRTIDLQHKDSVSSSLSEVWEEFGFDAKLKDTMGESMTSNEINVAESESMETFLEEKGFKVQEQTCILEDTRLKPLLSLVTETDNIWNLDSGFTQSLETATLADLQLTPPEENVDGKRSSVTGAKEELSSVYRKRELPDMLTPDSSKEEDVGAKERKGDRQIDLQDVWSFSAQRGLVKSGSGAAAYPESLDLWNTTIRDDSLSPLTTPDVEDLSERSDSLIGQVSSIEGGPLLESPLGYSECGMVMWNTTILEDNASSVTSPEGPGTGTDVGPSQDACSAGPDTNVSQRVQTQKQKYTINAVAERGVKIIIEEVDGGENDSVSHEPDQQNRMSEKWLNQASDQNLDSWTVPVPQMVNSTSEYENVGASAWSSPSPETHVSPAAHMMQLDRESSPFINVVPNMEDAAHFLYEGTELKHTTRSENVNKSEDNRGDAYDASDLKVQSVDDSPFILVDGSPLDTKSAGFQLSLGDAAMTQTGAHQTVKTDNSPLTTAESYRLTSYSDLSMDRKTKKRNSDPHIESRVLDGAAMDSTSVSPSSGGERDGLRFSRDSLHLSSRDDLRSNSDGDSSSGLEMESIVLSGSLTESKTERGNGFNRAWHSGRGTRVGKEETFSMLACAATRLKAQESRTHSRQNQMETENESPLSLNAGEKHAPSLQTSPDGQADVSIVLSGQSAYDKHTATQPLLREGKSSRESPDKSTTDTYGSRPCTTSIANTTKDYIVPEIICSNIAKRQPEIFLELNSTVICHSLSQAGEGITDYQSSITARSVPSSLRYPSDHFLKTREEVYVHSQISMEDSDDGVQSPSAPTYCPTTGNRIPPSTSEPASPELAHSSSSHNSSFITTPVSESGHPAEKVRVGSPFTGDLMEEVGNEEEEVGSAHPENQREGRAHITTPCPGPSEDLKGDSSSQLLLEPMTMRHLDELSSNQEIEGSPKYLPSQRHQEITSQPFDQPTCEYTLYQWTRDRSPTEYGYNYHHTDQRIECQSNHQGYVETSVDSTHLAGRSEMGFANRTIQTRPQQPQDGSGPKHQYSLGKLGQCKANLAINSGDTGGYPIEGPLRQIDKDGYETMRTSSNKAGGSERRSQYEDVVWSHCEAHNLQCDGQQFYPPAACHQSEDHAQYVPEGYTHFLLTRTCQQEDNAATTEMMKKVHFNEEDEGDHTEAVSNHRRKLAAPPLNVSLDHSEGSLTSDDGVETGDEALDTGDDLQLDLLDTTDGAESLEFNIHGECELSNQGAAAVVPEAIPEYSAAEECRDGDLWRIVVIGDQEHRVDMECIEPYRKVVSHGGYYGDQNAIIVFAACFLPDSNCENYNYVMENLFLYVISTLELMVADDYMIVYLNGATPRRRMPGFGWMKKCYQMIDRRLKKNLKLFIIVHPSWFIRTVLGLTRPFISFKFSSKIKYVHSLAELWVLVPMEYVYIPPSIVKYEEERRAHKFACMRLDEELQRTADKDKKGG